MTRMSKASRMPATDIDLSVPNAARIYDYLLGGAHNFAVDREFAHRMEQAIPAVRPAAHQHRAFLRRVVQFCVERGVRQFLDVGAGLPTLGNTHSVARAAAPESQVVYVDREPVVVAHSTTMLRDEADVSVVNADLLDVDRVLEAVSARDLLDLGKPVAVMMLGVVHSLSCEHDPAAVIRRYAERMAPGSYLGLSHFTADRNPEEMQTLVDLYRATNNPFTARGMGQVSAMLEPFDLVEPGLVFVPQWRPDRASEGRIMPEHAIAYGAVGLRS